MAAGLLPFSDQDEEYYKDQLAQALRKLGMEAPMGSGYQGGRVYIRGNGWGNVIGSLLGNIQEAQAREGLKGLEQAKKQARADFIASMPSPYKTVDQEISGPPQPGQEGQSLGTTQRQLPKSTQQYAQESRDWAIKAMNVPGLENIGAWGIQKQLEAPEKQAELEQKAAEQRQLAKDKADAAAVEARKHEDFLAQQAQMYKLTAAQQEDNKRILLGIMSQNAAKAKQDQTQVITDQGDGSVWIVDKTNHTVVPAIKQGVPTPQGRAMAGDTSQSAVAAFGATPPPSPVGGPTAGAGLPGSPTALNPSAIPPNAPARALPQASAVGEQLKVTPKSTAEKPLTQDQSKNVGWANTMLDTERVFNDVNMKNVDLAKITGLVRLGKMVPGMSDVTNLGLNEDEQRFLRAGLAIVDATGRRDSGQTVKESEWDNIMHRYVPTLGDAPKLREDKLQARKLQYESMKTAAGASYKPSGDPTLFDKAGTYPNAPPVGTVKGGFRYKGGDPSKQESWEPT
jgi:hypothetical protein